MKNVFNDRGSFKVKALISEAVPSGVVNIPNGWWPSQFIEGHLQNLLLPISSLEVRDETREIFWDLAFKRSGSGMGEFPETIFGYSPDTLFDCLCDVKKV